MEIPSFSKTILRLDIIDSKSSFATKNSFQTSPTETDTSQRLFLVFQI